MKPKKVRSRSPVRFVSWSLACVACLALIGWAGWLNEPDRWVNLAKKAFTSSPTPPALENTPTPTQGFREAQVPSATGPDTQPNPPSPASNPSPAELAAPSAAVSTPPPSKPVAPTLDMATVARTPTLWPRVVAVISSTPLPVVYDGRVVGQTTLPAGGQFWVMKVTDTQVELDNQGTRQWVPVGATDLLSRAVLLYNTRKPEVAAAVIPTPVPAVASGPRTAALPSSSETPAPGPYTARAHEVADEIQKDFWNANTGRYSTKPGGGEAVTVWGAGVMFSALVGAARNDPGRYKPVLYRFFEGLNAYWDRKQPLGGYEPAPTSGDGNDKYYDDNEWLVTALVEARLLTGQTLYSRRADETMKFVLSGWDTNYLGGGIWWHEKHEQKAKGKNTCSNAPAIVACQQLAKVASPQEAQNLLAMAEKIYGWTVANLQLPNGLYADSKGIEGGGLNKAQLTYNSALMLRANLGFYQDTGKHSYLAEAQRIAEAANALLSAKDGVYRDPEKWSHLMVEADLDLYRVTKEPYLLQRARKQVDAFYGRWKTDGPKDLITVASLSRVLWLMADLENESGREFWKQDDALRPGADPANPIL